MIRRLIYLALVLLLLIALMSGTTRRVSANSAYEQSVLATETASLIGYWPLNEVTGTTAFDSTGANRNCTYNSVTLNATTGPDGQPAALFDGINDYANCYTPSLATTFNGDRGTVALWVKYYSAWTSKRTFLIYVDASNRTYIQTQNVSFSYIAGGTTKIVIGTGPSTTGWHHLAITWDRSAGVLNGEMKAYLDGVQVGTAQTNLGTWAGIPAQITLGADLVNANYFVGYMAHAAIWTTALSGSQIASLADTTPPATATPTITPSPTPDIYSYIDLTSGQGARVSFEATVGDIVVVLFVIIAVGLLLWMIYLMNTGIKIQR